MILALNILKRETEPLISWLMKVIVAQRQWMPCLPLLIESDGTFFIIETVVKLMWTLFMTANVNLSFLLSISVGLCCVFLCY